MGSNLGVVSPGGIESIIDYVPNRDLRGNIYDDKNSKIFHSHFKEALRQGSPEQYSNRFHIGYHIAAAIEEVAQIRSSNRGLADKRPLSLENLKPDTDLRKFYGWDNDMFGLLECTANSVLHEEGVFLIGEFKNANTWNDCYQAALMNQQRRKGHLNMVSRARAAYSSLAKYLGK